MNTSPIGNRNPRDLSNCTDRRNIKKHAAAMISTVMQSVMNSACMVMNAAGLIAIDTSLVSSAAN